MEKVDRTTLISGILLLFVFFLSLCIRVAIPYKNVFNGLFVRFGGTDPWYNMRLVENTLQHFPHRIYFDPFTAYPHGAYNPFGTPLFDLSLALLIRVIGAGSPVSRVEVIGAWYPAVLGALTVFPVYFIGKGMYNRGTGLLSAALIAILPGEFLFRSLLGFTDHHAMETLLSTIAMLFFILALKSAKEKEITFYSVLRKEWRSLKKPLIYSSLAGISIGAYFLAWVGAPLLILILLIYALVQHIADHLRGNDTDYLCIISIPVFIIPLIMIIPARSYGFLSEFHLISLILGIIVPPLLTALSFSLRLKKKMRPYVYPIAILAVGIISLLLLSALNPSLYSTLTTPLLYVFSPSKSYLTIAEVQPMGWSDIWSQFSTTFFFALLALIWIGYNISKKWRREEILFVVWSAVILFACFGQKRFAAYLAINVAILCGFLSWNIIELLWFSGEEEEKEKSGRDVKRSQGAHKVKTGTKTRTKPKTKPKRVHAKKEKADKMWRVAYIVTIGFVIFLAFFSLPLLDSLTRAAGYSSGPSYDWYESLSWLREHTPDPGIDYYALYDTPFTYPKSAYSVMSWWDYGHWITYIAHRIPVANPFQQGIGGPYRGNAPGACVFFLAKSESEANKIADSLDVRYVVTDFTMPNAMCRHGNKYWAMTLWANDTSGHYDQYQTGRGTMFVMREKYFNTMITRLHMFDGREVRSEGEHIGKEPYISSIEAFHTSTLQHYRLAYESSSYMIPYILLDTRTKEVQGWDYYDGMNYTEAEKLVQKLHQGFQDPKEPNFVRMTPLFFSPVSHVKVFEYVKRSKYRRICSRRIHSCNNHKHNYKSRASICLFREKAIR